MATQALNPCEIESANPFMLRDILPGPGWSPYRADPAVQISDKAVSPVSNSKDGNGLIGAAVAFAFEAGVALCIFGIWQVWHLIR